MAGFTEKLKILIDVDSKGAVSGLSALKTKVGDADGFFGKLKAGAGGLKDMFNELGPAGKAGLAASGIGAVGAVAYDAVSKFSNLGVEVGKFRDATGLSADESSRWIEVAGEMGIDVGTLETALGKMNKNVDPEKFKELGVQIAYAKDGTVDANATFLNAIDRLAGMKDSTDRAKAGAELFGKGWQSIAEIVAGGADTMREKLAGVEKQKILNDEDITKAREFRGVMDDLRDRFDDVMLTLGKSLLPLFDSLGETVSQTAEDLQPLIDKLGQIIAKWNELPPVVRAALDPNPLAMYHAAVASATEVIDLHGKSQSEMAAMIRESGASTAEATELWAAWAEATGVAAEYADLAKSKLAGMGDETDTATGRVDDFYSSLADLNDGPLADTSTSLQNATDDARAFQSQYEELTRKIDDKQAWMSLQDSIGAYMQKLADSNASDREKRASLLETEQEIADYVAKLDTIPAEKKSEILALVDDGKVAEAYDILDRLAHPRTVVYSPSVGSGAGITQVNGTGGRTGRGAAGGIVTQPTLALIGEARPEAVVPLDQMPGASPLPAMAASKAITLNVYPRTMPTDRELADWIARAGRRGFMS
jgi:hypothetical protein